MVRSRRAFLSSVGRGTLLASLGPALAVDLGIVSRTYADDAEVPLSFGHLEPLVAMMQDTPVEQLQSRLFTELKNGTSLKTLVSAGILANARTFGGEDYIGFHTFMALGPALKMAAQMPDGSAALPVFKVLYRNTKRIQDRGGHSSEVLHQIAAASSENLDSAGTDLHSVIQSKDKQRAEAKLAALMANDRQSGLDALIPSVQDNPEVHRTVLPYRAWEMQEIVGTEHAFTLLRQSVRYCLRVEPYRQPEWDEHGKMLTSLLDEYKLEGKSFGDRDADDAFVQHLSEVFSNGTPADAARAAASALADGFKLSAIGEALSLTASHLVLRDGGRLPQYEELNKPAGGVHGDSVGVHASDSANAWRNMAKYANARNGFTCVIMGAWQIARDRSNPGNLITPLPAKHHLNRLASTNPDELLTKLYDAIRSNLQGHAVAATKLLSETNIDPQRVFSILLKYAVSEDGALHAEKYFHTVSDDFHHTRPTLRWQHLQALARVTASEYGRPAPGQDEARRLFGQS